MSSLSETFAGLSAHVQQFGPLLEALPDLPFFRAHVVDCSAADVAAITKLLHTSWSTEYALRATLEMGDDAFLAGALHWALPQAYYTALTSLQAFLYTLGVRSHNAQLLRREAGRLVVKNAYPRPLACYAAGAYGDFSVHRLPLAEYHTISHIAQPEADAQAGVRQGLKAARKALCQQVRRQVQDNPNTAIRSQKTGRPLDKWTKEHWQQITWRLGYTTVFDLLGLLHGPASVAPTADVRAFLAAVLMVIESLASIHEAYVARSLGAAGYAALLDALPLHLQNGFVTARAGRLALATGIEAQRAGLAHLSR